MFTLFQIEITTGQWPPTVDNSSPVTHYSKMGEYTGGYVKIAGGMSERNKGGNVSISGGYSESRDGGDVSMVTGRGNSQAQPINSQLWHDEVIVYTGVYVTSPAPGDALSNIVWDHARTQDDVASSGNMTIGTADAYPDLERTTSTGITGQIDFFTGNSGNGASGDMHFYTGHAVKGQAGDMTFTVGNSTDSAGYGETTGFDGGKINMTAGLSVSDGATGGAITLNGGLGVSSTSTTTKGGNVEIYGGNSQVTTPRASNTNLWPWYPSREANRLDQSLWTRNPNTTENGGAVLLNGGNSDRGTGGQVNLTGGYGSTKDGGWIHITGGDAYGTVSTCSAGQDDDTCDKGGTVNVTGGLSHSAYGGNITVKSGYSTATSSGSMNLGTDNAGLIGVSGGIFVDSGHTTNGPSGDLDVKTGNALFGAGGDMRFEVGTALAGAPLSSWYVEYTKVNFTDTGCTSLTGGGPVSCLLYADDQSPVTFLTLLECETYNATSCSAGSSFITCIKATCPNEYDLLPLACQTCAEALSTTTSVTTALTSCTASVLYFGAHRDGGDIVLTAGETQWEGQKGGDVYITGGLGSSNSTTDGGDGGHVYITGGESWGLKPSLDKGGNVSIAGGDGASVGGTVSVITGGSDMLDSGSLEFKTAPSGPVGQSGEIIIETGYSHYHSGNISVLTGDSENGYGGGILLQVGDALLHDDYCYCDVYGTDYRGNITTYDGTNSCANWNSTLIALYPDAGLGSVLVVTNVSDGMGDPHNECRNPDNSTSGPYCYDSSGNKQTCTTVVSCDSLSTPECCQYAGDSDGGDIMIIAGATYDNDATGGMVLVEGGAGKNAGTNGGNGGEVIIRGGEASGLTTTTDSGGDVTITGGAAYASYGGSLLFKSGFSNVTSSGSVAIETADSGGYGVTGGIALKTGYALWGASGSVTVDTGDAITGRAGSILLSVGASTELTGTALDCYCDINGIDYRGTVATTASGTCMDWYDAITDVNGNWTSLNAGLGSANITTFWNDEGMGDPHNYCRNPNRTLSAPWCFVNLTNVYTATLCTGISRCADGHDGVRCASTATHHGGDIILTAGEAKDLESKGGDVQIYAGDGTNTGVNGGDGGDIIIHAGEGFGATTTTDVGGSIEILAGNATSSYGGSLLIGSGESNQTSSGSITMYTADAGAHGVSGMMHMYTGSSTAGSSGGVKIETGNAEGGESGSIFIGAGVSLVPSDITCFCLVDGSDYRGTVSTTSTGATCLEWTESMIKQYPGAGLGSYLVHTVRSSGMGSPHNYCRNPTHHAEGPWCYVPGGHIEYCTSVTQCTVGLDGTRCRTTAPSDGGEVVIHGGSTADNDATGGSVQIFGGAGYDTNKNGGDGGIVHIRGGSAHGLTTTTDHAGEVRIDGGPAYAGLGGDITITSGKSYYTSSGNVNIRSHEAGKWGESGNVTLASGELVGLVQCVVDTVFLFCSLSREREREREREKEYIFTPPSLTLKGHHGHGLVWPRHAVHTTMEFACVLSAGILQGRATPARLAGCTFEQARQMQGLLEALSWPLVTRTKSTKLSATATMTALTTVGTLIPPNRGRHASPGLSSRLTCTTSHPRTILRLGSGATQIRTTTAATQTTEIAHGALSLRTATSGSTAT